MTTRHHLIATLGAALLAGAIAPSVSAQNLRIGLVLPELSNEAILDIDIGARARAEELGGIEIMTTGTYSGEEQAKAMENYIAAGVDVLAYDSIDGAATGPAVV